MNNGVVVCLDVLLSVFKHIDSQGGNCIALKSDDLVERIKPFGKLIGEYFATLTNSELHDLRRKVGNTGLTEVRHLVQSAIQDQMLTFDPPGLSEWLANRADDKRDDAKKLLDAIEQRVRISVVLLLKDRFGLDHSIWWQQLPQNVRLSVAQVRELDKRAKGPEENYITFNDCRKIILAHWQDLFQPVFAFGDTGNKDKRTEWLYNMSAIQSKLAISSATGLQMDEYNYIVSIDVWLHEKAI